MPILRRCTHETVCSWTSLRSAAKRESFGRILSRPRRQGFYRYHPQKPFLVVQFAVLEPKAHESRTFSGRLYCTPKALWKLNWFLRDFGYDPDFLAGANVHDGNPETLASSVSRLLAMLSAEQREAIIREDWLRHETINCKG